MYKFLVVLIMGYFLAGCAFIHKMDIEQGNVFTPEMVSQLHTGMTIENVKEIMGTPVLINTFNDDRIDYVYTFKPGGQRMTEQTVTLTFSQGILKEIQQRTFL